MYVKHNKNKTNLRSNGERREVKLTVTSNLLKERRNIRTSRRGRRQTKIWKKYKNSLIESKTVTIVVKKLHNF